MCALEPRSHMGPRVKLTNSPSKHIHAHTQSRGLVQKMSPLTVTRHKCVFCPGEPSNPQENEAGWDRSFLFLMYKYCSELNNGHAKISGPKSWKL